MPCRLLNKSVDYQTKVLKFIPKNADNSGNTESGASDNNLIGLNRYPFVSSNCQSTVYVYGFGTFDFTHLDRGERRGFVFAGANDIQMIGTKIINPCEWAVITYRSNQVLLSNVDVYGYRQNSDAFDICNSQNVTVQDCFVRTGDDAFCIKTLGGPDDASSYATNITVQNCYAWASKARAFGIFGEVNLPISNVTFKNCGVLAHEPTWEPDLIPAIGIVAVSSDSGNSGKGNISDITFDNVHIHNNKAAPITCVTSLPITISNITFNNVEFDNNNAGYPIRFEWFTSGANIHSINGFAEGSVSCSGTPITSSNWSTYLKDDVSRWIAFDKNS